MTQHVRLSQYVITYGPGAILEGQYGPRIIPQPEIGLFTPNSNLTPGEFEVSDPRMSQGLLGGARIFRLPSNAELGREESKWVYRTKAFPGWSLCLGTGHGGRFSVLYHGQQCPVCGVSGNNRREAIRFVRACPDGHLDDIYWTALVHKSSGCSHSEWFRWHGGGGSLNQVQLECPACRTMANFGEAYGRNWPCAGRFPEREPFGSAPIRNNCVQRARIVQRQASNLRLPELQTLFTIPPRATKLHNLLQQTAIRSLLIGLGVASIPSKEFLLKLLDNLTKSKVIPIATAQEIGRYSWEELRAAMQDVVDPIKTKFEDLLLEEFHELIDASTHGFPRTGQKEPLFEVNPSLVRRIDGLPNGRKLRVTPVSRLQTITVQTGYTRAFAPSGQVPNLVDISFEDIDGSRWYPGVQFLGEGLFLMLDEDDGWNSPMTGSPFQNWITATRSGSYPPNLFRTPTPDELHPVFVWWHTLSHLLIRAVSVDAGYSSAAIRERVYVEIDAAGNRARGGVILYATQPGSEGSLGGLIALAPHFERMLQRAVDMGRTCSNDPLCSDNHFSVGRYSGSACYGCLLISETSCEHRNLWLDREVLIA
jgi:hypothetical protein